MRRWQRVAVLVSMVGLMALVSGCGSASAVSATPSTLSIALPSQTSLSWFPPIVPTTDCYSLSGGGWYGPNPYMPLLWFGHNDTIDYAMSIATSVTPSHGDTLFTIKLNPKWHWSNGQPVTAADVAYDAQLLIAGSEPTAPWTYCDAGSGGLPGTWKHVTVVNAHELTIQTTTPQNPIWFINNGIGQIIPLPKAVWAKYSNWDRELSWIKSIASQPGNKVYRVVDGPYYVSKAVTNEYWTYTANPRFDGTKPAFKTVRFLYETSSASTFLALKKGTVAIAEAPTSYMSALKKLTHYKIVAPPLFGFNWIALNFRANSLDVGSLFNHLYIRQAMQMGIDQPAIIKLYDGYARPTYNPVPSAPRNAYYDYALKNPYPFDPTKGKALLELHGWHEVNGVMEKGGQKLSFPVVTGTYSAEVDEWELIQSDWAKEGIKITLYPSSLPSTAGKNWAAIGIGTWIYSPYPSGGALFASTGGVNQGLEAYNNPTMNTLINKTKAPATSRQTLTAFHAYEKYAEQQLPFLYVPTANASSGFLYAVSSSLEGFSQNWSASELYTPLNLVVPARGS